MLFVDNIGVQLQFETGTDLTDFNTFSIRVKRPDGMVVVWPATKVGKSKVQHTTINTDFDVEGVYIMQVEVSDGSAIINGETVPVQVHSRP